jgi:predicted ATPase
MRKVNHKLTKITIKGFKSIAFDKPITLDIGNINILLGANGAGKSNIISFFKMIGYMMNESLQQFIAQSGTNQKFLYYGSKKTPTLSAEIRFDGKDSYDIYRFSLTNAVLDRLIISSEEIEWRNPKNNTTFSKQLVSNFNESALNHLKSEDAACKIVWDILAGCKVYQFNESSALSPMRQASTVESAHYLQSEANNLASFLLYLKNGYKESYERIVSHVKEIVPQFKDFYLEPERGYVSLKWVDTSANDYVLSSDQFSDGSIRFIALATLLLQPEKTMPRVIIIDEPELGLHPYAIDQLTEMIKDASLHAQIIVATQSPSLIDGFDADDVTVIERDEDNQCSVARRLNGKDYSEWLDEYTLSELWNKNVIGGRPV